MYGDSPEVLDGTQLAADWTFSGLQKFGQGLQDRLRGLKLPSNILKKVCFFHTTNFLPYTNPFSGEYCRDSWYFGGPQASLASVSIQRCMPMVHRSCRHHIFGVRSIEA